MTVRLRFPSVVEVRKAIAADLDRNIGHVSANKLSEQRDPASLRIAIHGRAERIETGALEPPLPFRLEALIVGMSQTMRAKEAAAPRGDEVATEALGTFEMMANQFAQQAADLAVRTALELGDYQLEPQSVPATAL
jgi:hypothetical protein